MWFDIQFTCSKCGFQTDEGEIIGSMDIDNFYVGTCNDCHEMFNSSSSDKNTGLKCGSKFIEFYPNEKYVRCPKCGCRVYRNIFLMRDTIQIML